MNLQLENSINEIAEQARGRYHALLKGARQRTENAAGTVIKGKGPIKTVARLGLQLTAVSHKTADQVLKQQTRMLENQIDALATRLRAVSKATDIRDLLGTQIRLIPVNASRFASDTRDTLKIVTSAGQQIGNIVKGTVTDLRSNKPARARKPARKTAKKAARKGSAKKAPASKVATPAGQKVAVSQKAA